MTAVQIIAVVVAAVVGYLIGSLNFALIVSRVGYHQDIRQFGSGNAGMTNMLRTYGKLPALLTLLGDFGKGILAILLGRLIFLLAFSSAGFFIGDAIVGFSALLGHVFPVYYRFRGGKGVLVTAGILLMIDWVVLVIIFAVFLIVFALSRIISLSSILASAAYPIATLGKALLLSQPAAVTVTQTVLAVLIAGLVLYMHRSNIKRLLAHTEPKVGK